MNKNLKICTWNVNGLRAMIKKGELHRLIETGVINIYMKKTQISYA
jgi:exonuclease III